MVPGVSVRAFTRLALLSESRRRTTGSLDVVPGLWLVSYLVRSERALDTPPRGLDRYIHDPANSLPECCNRSASAICLTLALETAAHGYY